MRLYSHYRSSAAYRVRIALNFKGLEVEMVTLDLAKREQRAPDYLALNPQGLVPVLDTGAGVLTQSPAIIEWLEESYPQPPLLPSEPLARAHVRGMAAIIGADTHPLQNRRVLGHLKREMKADQDTVYAWARHWTAMGFEALERLILKHDGRFAYGETPTLVDIFLIPHLYNARMYGLDLSPFPNILSVEQQCAEIWAFAAAHPDRQPDAPKS